MTLINWAMSPEVYEDMVSCLLSHLNRETRRIDGSGGDGGRDVQFELPDGLHIFELKSFTDRMTQGRRRQVERSLARAAKLKPVRSELIVPIDPTVKELDWFNGLRKKYSFPIEWRGKTWLDTHFAERLFIWRYFCEGAKAEVFELLRELHKEEAGLERGMPDVIERLQALALRANELDPFFVFKVELDGPRTKVAVIPRYKGALEDRPITVRIDFVFPTDTPEGQAKLAEFQRANDYGAPIEIEPDFIRHVDIDAPAGLGGTFERMHISIGPGHVPWATPIDFEFLAVNESGDPVERLVVTLAPESAGQKGVIMTGHDRSGLFHAQIIFGPEPVVSNNVKLALESGPFVPHELLEAVRFFASLHAPNQLTVRMTNGSLSAQPVSCPSESLIEPVFAEFVGNLAMIQAATGIVREVPGDLEHTDLANAAAGAALVRGEEAQQSWTELNLRLNESLHGPQRRLAAEQPIFFKAELEGAHIVPVCGIEYPIGRKRQIEAVGRVEPALAQTLLTDDETEVAELVLHPEPNTHMKVRILSR